MKAPARAHTEVWSATAKIGEITSGGFGPTLKAACAMGYVETPFAADGTAVNVVVRGKQLPAEVSVIDIYTSACMIFRTFIKYFISICLLNIYIILLIQSTIGEQDALRNHQLSQSYLIAIKQEGFSFSLLSLLL